LSSYRPRDYRPANHQNIDSELDELGRELGSPVKYAFEIALFDEDAFAFGVAEFT
jgi:hypothetical protein